MIPRKNILHIDIETYSSVDIAKSGLYKYVQSPDFQILLFAYAYDDGPVEIIDLAQGENQPQVRSLQIMRLIHERQPWKA